MRDLDRINPEIALPRNFCSIGAALPLIMTGIGAALASGATPRLSILENTLAVACLFGVAVSCTLFLVPIVFKWDWQAKFFGVASLYFVGPALLGVIPWLCVVLYSALPLWIRVGFFCGYALPIICWCRRFIELYRKIYSNPDMRDILYSEGEDAVYYQQKGDLWLMERKFKFRQTPSEVSFVVAIVFAALSIPFASRLTHIIGLPYVHIFMATMGLPIIMMSLGIVTRGYLIFYYYPWKIRRSLRKIVYVDMDAKPELSVIQKRTKDASRAARSDA